MSSRAIGKISPLLFADCALDLGCSYIFSSIHIWLAWILLKQWTESCLFLRQQYTNYGMKNELIVAEKQKDEQWYLETKLIKSNNKLKPGEIWIKLKGN